MPTPTLPLSLQSHADGFYFPSETYFEKYQPATLPAMTRCWQATQNWVSHRNPNMWYLKTIRIDSSLTNLIKINKPSHPREKLIWFIGHISCAISFYWIPGSKNPETTIHPEECDNCYRNEGLKTV